MLSVSSMTTYTREGGGSKQKMFLKDTEVGWKKVKNDTQRNMAAGVAQYDGVRLGEDGRPGS